MSLTASYAPPLRASIRLRLLNRTRTAKSAKAVFGPDESAITLSITAMEGVASQVAVKMPVWLANDVLTQAPRAGVVKHSATTLKLQTVADPSVSTIAPQWFRFVTAPAVGRKAKSMPTVCSVPPAGVT